MAKKQLDLLPEKWQIWETVYEYVNKQPRFKGIKIDLVKLVDFLIDIGYSRHDMDNGTTLYTYTNQNRVQEVTRKEIIDTVIRKIKTLEKYDYEDIDYVTPEVVIRKMYAGLGTYFKEDILDRMIVDKQQPFITDTKDELYLLFDNTLAVVTKNGIETRDYDKVDGRIWEKQVVKKHPFELVLPKIKLEEWMDVGSLGMFEKFCWNISGKSTQRFRSLCTIIGYNMHYYFEDKRRVTILTDSTISENPEGRTGKTLLGKAISEIRNVTEINGKDFSPDDKFRWQEVNPSTQLVILNDLRRHFDIECVFNDVTEGIGVQYKNAKTFRHNAKFIASTNMTVRIQGGSAKDRVVEYELADHYSATYSPADEFGCWFFRDWDAKHYNLFYNFMAYCALMYLRHGMIKPESINLGMRTMVDHTCQEFVSFVQEEGREMLEGKVFWLQDLFASFKTYYPDARNWDRFRTQQFTKFLQHYADAKGYTMANTRSNGKNKITFS